MAGSTPSVGIDSTSTEADSTSSVGADITSSMRIDSTSTVADGTSSAGVYILLDL
jgi:hypothetical protein